MKSRACSLGLSLMLPLGIAGCGAQEEICPIEGVEVHRSGDEYLISAVIENQKNEKRKYVVIQHGSELNPEITLMHVCDKDQLHFRVNSDGYLSICHTLSDGDHCYDTHID